jgi:acetyl-CoA acetyltransferase
MRLGVAPRIMGIAPVTAIRMVLDNAGITIDNVDLFEVTKGSRLINMRRISHHFR